MKGYDPLKISGYTTGLVQSRENFLLPADAYPILENFYVWRERLKRKEGYKLLGRLRRVITGASLGISGASPWSFNIYSTVIPAITGEPNAQIKVLPLAIAIGGVLFTSDSAGNLTPVVPNPGNFGTINFSTGNVTITYTGPPILSAISFEYYPGLPVMGLINRELDVVNNEQTVAFDTKYAYIFNLGQWQEFIPGTTWTGTDYNFFWGTNYWVNASNLKLFWVTNGTGQGGDPIRYTDGVTWTNFAPTINAAGDVVAQCLCILPFRSRLVFFNTWEGPSLANCINIPQRIRWAQIGSPLTADAWRDDIRGRGGFLDIPTSEAIISVGFVRDNLVIYCERSTWQLRYTGRSIAPFQIEKVNSELGAESTFSLVQFDTSIVGVGDKGIVECDSYQAKRIDIKIPDLVYQFSNIDFEYSRVHGIRDQQQRLVYWSFPYAPQFGSKYPNRRLVFNYENDSWAIFIDSFTCFGTFQATDTYTWIDFAPLIPENQWVQQNYSWISRPSLFPSIIGGNQQGYVEFMGSNLEKQIGNDNALFISAIQGNDTTPTVVTSPNHNLETDQVIEIENITGTGFSSLNGGIFAVKILNANQFELWLFNPLDGQFSLGQFNPSTDVYIGGGEISIRDGFSIVSKKFSFMEDGQSIQIGYVDMLMNSTAEGAITMNMFLDYNTSQPSNQIPQNQIEGTFLPDTFFNTVIPTTQSSLNNIVSDKYWHRVFCATRADFLTIQLLLSNAQLVGIEQESDIQIDAQIIWMRKAGRMNPL